MTSENSGLLLSPLQNMSTPEVLYIQFFCRLFFKSRKGSRIPDTKHNFSKTQMKPRKDCEVPCDQSKAEWCKCSQSKLLKPVPDRYIHKYSQREGGSPEGRRKKHGVLVLFCHWPVIATRSTELFSCITHWSEAITTKIPVNKCRLMSQNRKKGSLVMLCKEVTKCHWVFCLLNHSPNKVQIMALKYIKKKNK